MNWQTGQREKWTVIIKWATFSFQNYGFQQQLQVQKQMQHQQQHQIQHSMYLSPSALSNSASGCSFGDSQAAAVSHLSMQPRKRKRIPRASEKRASTQQPLSKHMTSLAELGTLNGTLLSHGADAQHSAPAVHADGAWTGQLDDLNPIIELQKSSGIFRWGPVLEKIFGANLAEMMSKRGPGCPEELWLTALVIAFLETKMAERKASWELLVMKAKKSLKKHLNNDLDQLQDLLNKAGEHI